MLDNFGTYFLAEELQYPILNLLSSDETKI